MPHTKTKVIDRPEGRSVMGVFDVGDSKRPNRHKKVDRRRRNRMAKGSRKKNR